MGEDGLPHNTLGVSVFLSNGGENGKLVREMDWSGHVLGPPHTWPPSLQIALSICLSSKFPTAIYWGKEFTTFYNDAHIKILGKKHPWAIGKPMWEVWPETWPEIKDMMEGVMATSEATWSEDRRFFLQRHDYPEETYFTWSFGPIKLASGAAGGLYVAVAETTERVIGERRLRTLRTLSEVASGGRTVQEACEKACSVLGKGGDDVPFALVYLLDAHGTNAHLAAAAGLEVGTPFSPAVVTLVGDPKTALVWPLEQVAQSGTVEVVEDVAGKCNSQRCGPWPEPISSALVLPIQQPGATSTAGILVVGVSPRLSLDEHYRAFYDLVAGHIGTAIANASAYEEERKRVEALAELDRAKTTFFSNVSHEFRTPLTLMLGPLEDLLNKPVGASSKDDRTQIEVVYRNSLRLLKLVNMILDFTRVEQGRSLASYEPLDLAVVTTELASGFRSVVEKAGLHLLVNCAALPEPIYVDREMWEKIVLNLLSNAFKFTMKGEIEVKLSWEKDHVALSVRDTGSGIPEAELQHMFERFHRVKGAVGRSFEGSGIGLSLVRELVALHHGTVGVTSEVDKGTVFTVNIPSGSKHLPAERVKPSGAVITAKTAGSQAFIEEAQRWLPVDVRATVESQIPAVQEIPVEVSHAGADQPLATKKRHCILLADDNVDLRDYIRRLLVNQYEVIAVPDGRAALEVARKRVPDLVLTDVMMPNLDGFELLKELRGDPRTRTLPVIMISARAGEEARIDGLAAGADDYLVKPFSAKDLMARVESNLKLSRLRQEVDRAVGREEMLKETNRRKDEFMAMLAHELRNPLAPIRYAMHTLRTIKDAETVDRSREVVERQVKHLSHLVDDLLDMSRITGGKIDLQKEPMEFVGFVRHALEDHKPALEAAGLTLRQVLPDKPIKINGDATRLAQIIDNLLNNALKFSKPGGIISVTVAPSQRSGEVCFRISDTGIGIDPAFQARLFDPFAQADRSLDRTKGGLGLGLALVKGMAELHGGRVAASSDGIGQGSTFAVWLPCEVEAVAQPAVSPSPTRKGAKVLIVEDNKDSADSLSMLLNLNGYDVTVTYTGREALDAVEKMIPDVVLCDIGLPEMDGFAVAQALRHNPKTAQVRLIAVTGYGREEDKRKAFQAGFNDHLVKPVDPETLLERLVA